MANLNLKAGNNITLTKTGEDLEISSNQSEIIVSPTEPNTGEEVWVQKGKNLFTINQLKLNNCTLSGNNELFTLTGTNGYASIDGTQKVGTYTISGNISGDINYIDLYINGSFNRETLPYTYNLSSDATIGLVLYPGTYNNFQIEQGSTATTYEAYIAGAIYTKNDNIYNKFYDSNKNAVAISSSQPSEGAIWFQKGKNLFNENNYILGHINLNTGVIESNNDWASSIFEVDSNTDYVYQITTNDYQQYEIAYYSNTTFISGTFGDFSNGTNSVQFTTPNNCNYVRVGWRADLNNYNKQVEQGSTATTYEAYVDKKIYTKNSNGVYEEFYDESEASKEIISVGISNNFSLTTINTMIKITGYVFIAKIGGKLLINSDEGILIPSGYRYAKVSANVRYDNISSGTGIFALIYKNSTAINNSADISSGSRKSLQITPIIIPVSAGDYIRLFGRTDVANATISSDTAYTNLTIELIK